MTMILSNSITLSMLLINWKDNRFRLTAIEFYQIPVTLSVRSHRLSLCSRKKRYSYYNISYN